MNEQITITEIVIKSLIINIFIYITIFKINGEKINVKFCLRTLWCARSPDS